jgi:hypothetical protein
MSEYDTFKTWSTTTLLAGVLLVSLHNSSYWPNGYSKPWQYHFLQLLLPVMLCCLQPCDAFLTAKVCLTRIDAAAEAG